MTSMRTKKYEKQNTLAALKSRFWFPTIGKNRAIEGVPLKVVKSPRHEIFKLLLRLFSYFEYFSNRIGITCSTKMMTHCNIVKVLLALIIKWRTIFVVFQMHGIPRNVFNITETNQFTELKLQQRFYQGCACSWWFKNSIFLIFLMQNKAFQPPGRATSEDLRCKHYD